MERDSNDREVLVEATAFMRRNKDRLDELFRNTAQQMVPHLALNSDRLLQKGDPAAPSWNPVAEALSDLVFRAMREILAKTPTGKRSAWRSCGGLYTYVFENGNGEYLIEFKMNTNHGFVTDSVESVLSSV